MCSIEFNQFACSFTDFRCARTYTTTSIINGNKQITLIIHVVLAPAPRSICYWLLLPLLLSGSFCFVFVCPFNICVRRGDEAIQAGCPTYCTQFPPYYTMSCGGWVRVCVRTELNAKKPINCACLMAANVGSPLCLHLACEFCVFQVVRLRAVE